jgi:hypothetical protein
MSAEERMSVIKKEYENGIGKGRYDKWEEQYAEFEDYDGMPKDGRELSNWKKHQLDRFEARIKTKNAANDGSTIYGAIGERNS